MVEEKHELFIKPRATILGSRNTTFAVNVERKFHNLTKKCNKIQGKIKKTVGERGLRSAIDDHHLVLHVITC